MKLSEYKIKSNKLGGGLTFALVSDLHGGDWREALRLVNEISPDFILAPGDIFEPLDDAHKDINECGFEFLTACQSIAPTVFSPGNHEVGGVRSWSPKWRFTHGKQKTYTEENMKRLEATGVCFLDDAYTTLDGIAFGGLGSGLINDDRVPKLSALDGFFASDAPKVLLCHHPEYYKKYLADKNIDLIVSGHAHGGQWRFFGRGVFAPGQGLFPQYTSGVHDGRLVISRGMKESELIPRIFNPTEVVKIVIENN